MIFKFKYFLIYNTINRLPKATQQAKQQKTELQDGFEGYEIYVLKEYTKYIVFCIKTWFNYNLKFKYWFKYSLYIYLLQTQLHMFDLPV